MSRLRRARGSARGQGDDSRHQAHTEVTRSAFGRDERLLRGAVAALVQGSAITECVSIWGVGSAQLEGSDELLMSYYGTCPNCNGRGQTEVECNPCGGTGHRADGSSCPHCRGLGRKDQRCSRCGGTGKIEKSRPVQFGNRSTPASIRRTTCRSTAGISSDAGLQQPALGWVDHQLEGSPLRAGSGTHEKPERLLEHESQRRFNHSPGGSTRWRAGMRANTFISGQLRAIKRIIESRNAIRELGASHDMRAATGRAAAQPAVWRTQRPPPRRAECAG